MAEVSCQDVPGDYEKFWARDGGIGCRTEMTPQPPELLLSALPTGKRFASSLFCQDSHCGTLNGSRGRVYGISRRVTRSSSSFTHGSRATLAGRLDTCGGCDSPASHRQCARNAWARENKAGERSAAPPHGHLALHVEGKRKVQPGDRRP